VTGGAAEAPVLGVDPWGRSPSGRTSSHWRYFADFSRTLATIYKGGQNRCQRFYNCNISRNIS